jgi:murein DD-endopeptidase MepM/ murein hydrolase activator NlpD
VPTPVVPTAEAGLPWHGIGTAFAAAAVGLVTYVGFTGAQLVGMASATAEPLPVAEPPVLATYAAPSEEPAEEPAAPHAHAPEPAKSSAPSRAEKRPAKPAPSKAAKTTEDPEPAAPPTKAKSKSGAAPKAARKQTLEVKHATWADRQLARMLSSMPTSPISWYGGSWVVPTSGYHLTATFGESGRHWSSTHTGLDFAAPTGTPVRAVTGGTVTSTGYAGAYGNRIVLTHPDGSETWYCHLSRINVTTGGQIGTGAVIGAVGATGNVTGPHLHLEVRTAGGTPVDPYQALVQHGVRP